MPIYEYKCSDCSEQFEVLVRSGTVAQCPSCLSQKLEKQLSVFSKGQGALTSTLMPAGTTLPGPCGSCGHPAGPGSCGIH